MRRLKEAIFKSIPVNSYQFPLISVFFGHFSSFLAISHHFLSYMLIIVISRSILCISVHLVIYVYSCLFLSILVQSYAFFSILVYLFNFKCVRDQKGENKSLDQKCLQGAHGFYFVTL